MGGKKGGGGKTPYEAPDSLRSAQRLRAMGLISLGPIKGTVNKWKTTYFDNTPIQNEEGIDDNDADSFNFKNTEIQFNLGTQDQLPLSGFEMSEREVPVNAEVKRSHPLTRTVIDPDITRVRLTLAVNALFSQNDEGDTHGSSVVFEVLLNNRSHRTFTIEGKSSSRFFRSYMLEELPPVPFTITVKRVTADSTSQRVQNATSWASYTEIIDTKLSYPNMAMVGIKTDSRYNSNFPNINFLLHGRIIKVPSNYDPVTRTYGKGLWKGDFKLDWTNNPAWIFYDLVTNKLCGLGERLGDFGVDKFQLYQIAKYCDQLVPDGYGGEEPRMTANLWITDQRDAYQVISDMASVFRAMVIWNGTQLSATQDRPTDPVCTYSQANVIGGKFSRQYVSKKAIYTAVEVEYADKRNMYQKAIEYVADDQMIVRYGYNVKKITAFACTSRGQAHRYGRWVLETSRLEQCTITFSVGREGLRHLPGDIIEIADNSYAALNLGGRVLAVKGREVQLDREVQLNGDCFLGYWRNENEQNRIEHIAISRVTDNGRTVILANEPIGLTEMSVWSLHTPQVKKQRYRAIGISENEDGSFSITALQHEAKKEALVDHGISFEPEPTTTLRSGVLPVSNAEITTDGSNIKLNFQAPAFIGQGLKYQVKLYRNGNLFNVYDELNEPNIAFSDLPDGDYIAEIRAKNSSGQLSNPVSKTFSINFAISELVTVSKVFGIGLSWRNPLFANPNASIEIWAGRDNNFQHARKLVTLAYPTNSYSYDGLGVNERYFFWARMVDKTHSGEFTEAVEGVTEHSGEKLVGYLQGQITKSELAQGLASEITNMSEDLREEIKNRQGATSAISAQLQQEVQQRTQALQQEARERGTAISQLENADQEQAKQLATLTAKTNQAVAGIAEERSARTRENEANAQRFATLTTQVGQANSNISRLEQAVNSANSATATRMTNLESRFSGDLTNLCLNPSMAENTHGWTNMERAQVDGQWVGVAKDRDCLYGNWLSVKPGDVFYCSAWVKNKNATQDLGIGLFITKDGNNHHWIRAAYISPEQARDWTKIEGYITVPADTNSAHMWFQIEKPWHSAGDCYLRDVIFTKSNNVSPALARVQSVGNTLSTLEGKVNATYTLKTEVMRNGKRAVAGIALGAGINANTAESQVIISAEKLAIADPNSATLTTPFIVANENGRSRVAINGDLITNGSITGAKIQANSHINAPHIQGGHIDIGNGQFVVDNQGRLTANQGIFRGRIEASDGYFNGIVRADKIEGDVLKMFTCRLGEQLIIPSAPFARSIILMPFSMMVSVQYYEKRERGNSSTYITKGTSEGEVWIDFNGGRKAHAYGRAHDEADTASFPVEIYDVIPANQSLTIFYENRYRFLQNNKWRNWERSKSLSPIAIMFFVTKA